MVKYWLVDDVYAEDEYGSHILHSLERAQRFNRWMAESIAPHVGARVLEIGAGIGNITTWLLPRDLYVASDINPHYLHYLKNLAAGKPYLNVDRIDLEDASCFAPTFANSPGLQDGPEAAGAGDSAARSTSALKQARKRFVNRSIARSRGVGEWTAGEER